MDGPNLYTLCNMGARVAPWSDFHLGCFGGDSVSSHGRNRVRETCSDVTEDDFNQQGRSMP